MESEYNLSFNQLFGFVLIKNRTREEIPLSDSEAFKWSKKPYVAVNLDAQDKMDEILKHDIWWDAEQCLEYGLVDEII